MNWCLQIIQIIIRMTTARGHYHNFAKIITSVKSGKLLNAFLEYQNKLDFIKYKSL